MSDREFREFLEKCLRNNDLDTLKQLRSDYKLTTTHRYTFISGDRVFSVRTNTRWHYHVLVREFSVNVDLVFW